MTIWWAFSRDSHLTIAPSTLKGGFENSEKTHLLILKFRYAKKILFWWHGIYNKHKKPLTVRLFCTWKIFSEKLFIQVIRILTIFIRQWWSYRWAQWRYPWRWAWRIFQAASTKEENFVGACRIRARRFLWQLKIESILEKSLGQKWPLILHYLCLHLHPHSSSFAE